MRHGDHARPSSYPDAVRVPDQVQQAKRPDASGRERDPERPGEPRRTAAQAGVLGQLETERGHD